MSALRPCCQQAALDGETPEQHYPRCSARSEDPPTTALVSLSELLPEEGGPRRDS